jgi:hypothetical protein
MRESAAVITGGHEIRVESKIVRFPDRYVDPRGEQMFAATLRRLKEISGFPCLFYQGGSGRG